MSFTFANLLLAELFYYAQQGNINRSVHNVRVENNTDNINEERLLVIGESMLFQYIIMSGKVKDTRSFCLLYERIFIIADRQTIFKTDI